MILGLSGSLIRPGRTTQHGRPTDSHSASLHTSGSLGVSEEELYATHFRVEYVPYTSLDGNGGHENRAVLFRQVDAAGDSEDLRGRRNPFMRIEIYLI